MSNQALSRLRPARVGQVSGKAVSSDLPARWNPQHPLLWVLAAAAIGIIVDRWTTVPLSAWLGLVVGLLLLSGWLFATRGTWYSALVVLGSVAALAGLWHHHRWNLYPAGEISRFVRDVPEPVLVRVKVLGAPRHATAAREAPLSTMMRRETTRLDVHVSAIRQGSVWRRASGRLLLIVNGRLAGERVLRGDRLEIAGLLAAVRPPLNPGEPDFAGMCRARRQRAVLLCDNTACVRCLHRAGPWNLLRQLGRLRLAAEATLDRHVGPRGSPLAAALLLGSRERLQQETIETFFVSGTLHFLAISGLHVGILATVFWALIRLQWLSRHGVLSAASVVVVNYALLTGARPPVMRATILIVIYCLARGTGRLSQPWNSLAAAGLITLALRPSGLFDTGTQLSFLAVATLIRVWPWFASHGTRDPLRQLIVLSQPRWVRAARLLLIRAGQLVLVSAAVWLVSLPLVAYRFHLVTPIGLLLTVLLWLPLTAALFSALLTTLTSPLPLVPDLFGACCGSTLSAVEWLTQQAAHMPCGHGWVVGPPWWWVTTFYMGLYLQQFTRLGRLSSRWRWGLLCGLLALGIACGSCSTRMWRKATQQPLRVSFIAVGHGSAVLVQFPDGRVLLYDAGRMGSPRAAALPISSVLWHHRIHHIDALLLSHADADHFNAVPALLERFSVGIVYVSPVMFREHTPALDALRTAINNADVPLGQLHENMRLADCGDVSIEVMHPPPNSSGTLAIGSGDNENSIVIQLTYRRHRILLTGDIEAGGLDELLAEMPVSCDVLQAPHHGSQRSRPADVVHWAKPSSVVISAGTSFRIEQAEKVYGDAAASVFWTHRDGMIEVVSNGQVLRVSAWRNRSSQSP